MKTIPQITSAEPKIRIPAWRRASPKKRKTRALKMSPKTAPENRTMSPNEAIQSRGIANQPFIGLHAAARRRRGEAHLSPDRSPRIRPPKDLGAHHPDQ